MSHLMTKPTNWHGRPARSAWASAQSDQSLSAWRKLGSLATHWAHGEDWSDLSLRWAHSHFVGFCRVCEKDTYNISDQQSLRHLRSLASDFCYLLPQYRKLEEAADKQAHPLRKRLRIRSVISVNYHYITVLWPFNLLIRFKCYDIV